MLNMLAGAVGLVVQAAIFATVYLISAPRRGRSLAILMGLLVAVDGYAVVCLGAMLLGIPWTAFNPILAVVIGLSLVSSRLRGRLRRTSDSVLPLLRRHVGALAIVAAVVLVQVVAAALSPELSIDGQLYHGPVLAELVQHGTIWGWDVPNQYMFYTDLTMVTGLNLATFTGATVFDNGIQIPHLAILIAAISALLRPRFPSSWSRAPFAALMVTTPVIWMQPRILYVDLGYAAAIVAAIALMTLIRRPRTPDLIVLAVTVLAIPAMKPAGLLTGALLIGVAVVVMAIRGRNSGARDVLRGVARFAIALLIVGPAAAAFYLRNLIEHGSPVYPVTTSFGPIVFPGIIDFSVFASGDRGSGLVDPLRWKTYADNLLLGMTQGVLKTDYDPRAGGFGYMPLIVLVLAIALVAVGLVVTRRGMSRPSRFLIPWRPQLLMAVVAAVILLLQPATFDARYVIGPTVVLLCAILLFAPAAPPRRWVGALVATIALVAASAQILWTERNVYPGLGDVRALSSLNERYQPNSPGNPWGQGFASAWLPDAPDECVKITVQTNGGVGSGGVLEATTLTTLPYALYGPGLCNDVIPVQLAQYTGSATRQEDPTVDSDFLVLYQDDETRWKRLLPDFSSCLTAVEDIDADVNYPIGVRVFANRCTI
ncbi:hypothetical protein [Naasia lichenicola]|uniref:Glycosyltransferase RgtA/B/C/D-like domain-containing protein n=1 Tax=Naasia lichenicola TaxID=2565933 RepID=A0A4V3WT68_9MICO|nr:hypothetical protein [Naasia lichenicola]THG30817.1 hypothetical protein E6C64_09270 [Naasia lichenicola]